jgi:hypothetical protein
MPTTEPLTRLAPYVGRLLEDEHLQDEVKTVVRNLRAGSSRARKRGPRKAIGDRTVRRRLSAAGSTASAIARELREPAPARRPRRRRGGGLTVAALAAGATAVAYQRTRSPGGDAGDG